MDFLLIGIEASETDTLTGEAGNGWSGHRSVNMFTCEIAERVERVTNVKDDNEIGTTTKNFRCSVPGSFKPINIQSVNDPSFEVPKYTGAGVP